MAHQANLLLETPIILMYHSHMRILGIDPGTNRIGWGFVEGVNGKTTHHFHGCIDIPPNTDITIYLQEIHTTLLSLIDSYQPKYAAIEKLFFQRNHKTAMKVSQARGVIILALAERGIPFLEYAPNTVKRVVAGAGNADKKMVQTKVAAVLKLKEVPKPDDAADALAVAITAAWSPELVE